mgnify:CR=1 FL=1
MPEQRVAIMVKDGVADVKLNRAEKLNALDQAMFHVVGCDTTVALAAQAGQLELNVMMPVMSLCCTGMDISRPMRVFLELPRKTYRH